MVMPKCQRNWQAKWMKMIETYLDTSEALRVVFLLLIDIRHEPSKKMWKCTDFYTKKGSIH